MDPSPAKTLTEWLDNILPGEERKFFYIGPECTVPSDYVKTPHPHWRGFSCDAIFISCRHDVCDEFLMGVALPLLMHGGCTLFRCSFDHVSDEEPCRFTQVVSAEDAHAMLNASWAHEGPIVCEACIPKTSVMLTRIISDADATD
jgi:hypothetical protein